MNHSGRPCVLYVEDDFTSLRYVRAALSSQYKVLTAQNGVDGLAVLEQAEPDLLILDLMMPDMNGFDLLCRVRAMPRFATLPILVATALTDSKSRLKCYELGCTDFLTKPLERFELLARVRNMVGLYRTTRELLLQGSRSLTSSEQALQQQKQLLAAINNSTADLIFYKDLEGVYLGSNLAFGQLAGKEPHDIVGCTDFDLFPRDVAESFREQDLTMLEQGDVRSNEEWITYSDGRRLLVDTKKMPLRTPDNRIIGLIGIARDITGRKELEDVLMQQALHLEKEMLERELAQVALDRRSKELEQLNRTLEELVAEEVRKNREKDSHLLQQDKLASIGQLAAGVAHEINNPMGFISSNLTSLKEYSAALQQYCRVVDEVASDLADGARGRLAAVRKQLDLDYILGDLQPLLSESIEGAERVRRIVLDLKDFARTDSNEMEPSDLNQLIESTINIVRNELKYVAQLDLQLGELPSLLCHPQQINQVISNLLVNAAHAIEQQGVITVTTSQQGDHVVLMIADTGKGIPPELCSRIFDPFFTTKAVGKGTGLGLSISYDIVKKHGGEITVESAVGVGTAFTVKLPVNAAKE